MQLAKKDLLDALTRLKTIVPRKPSLPILGAIKISCRVGGMIKLHATDLDNHLELKISNKGRLTERWEAVVNFADLLSVVKSASRGDIGIFPSGQSLKIRDSEGAEIALSTHSLSDFPEFPGADERLDGRTNASGTISDLSGALKIVEPSMSTDPRRPALGGALLAICDGGCDVVATDGRQLARTHRRVSGYDSAEINLCAETVYALSEMHGDIAFELTEYRCLFFFADGRLSSALNNSPFPHNWRLYLTPPEDCANIMVPCPTLRREIANLQKLAVKSKYGYKECKLECKEGDFSISADCGGLGVIKKKLCESPADISYDDSFDISRLKALITQESGFLCLSIKKNLALIAAGEDQNTFALMPLRTN